MGSATLTYQHENGRWFIGQLNSFQQACTRNTWHVGQGLPRPAMLPFCTVTLPTHAHQGGHALKTLLQA